MKLTFHLLLLLFLLAAPAAESMAQVHSVAVAVDGMSCPFCAFGVEKKLKAVPGVRTVDVDMQAGMATVHSKEGASIDVSKVPKAIRDSGFTPGPVRMTVTGKVMAVDGRLVLEAPGLHRPVALVGGEERVREHLRSLAGTGKAVEIGGPVRNPEGEVWELTPEQTNEVGS